MSDGEGIENKKGIHSNKYMFTEISAIQTIIDNTIRKILLNDKALIKKGQELALSNKFGMYLFHDFSGWDVDCEYNRVGFEDELKRNSRNEYKRPDIIIHKRGYREIENNLLWIEIKVNNEDIEKDLEKLKEFTSLPNENRTLQYKYGLSISFIPSIHKIWIENGIRKDLGI